MGRKQYEYGVLYVANGSVGRQSAVLVKMMGESDEYWNPVTKSFGR